MSAPSRVSLKNIKWSSWASHETHCVDATVCIDGKRVCKYENDGRGGSNTYYPYSGQSEESFRQMLSDLRQVSADDIKENDPKCYAQYGNGHDDLLVDIVVTGCTEPSSHAQRNESFNEKKDPPTQGRAPMRSTRSNRSRPMRPSHTPRIRTHPIILCSMIFLKMCNSTTGQG